MATAQGFTQGIFIDKTFYDIPLVSIKRNADFLEKFAERNEAGEIIGETIGVYYNYTVNIGVINDPVLYKKLFEDLTSCRNRYNREVILPNDRNDFVFHGYFSSISDEVSKVFDNHVEYKGLTFKMTSRVPTKK